MNSQSDAEALAEERAAREDAELRAALAESDLRHEVAAAERRRQFGQLLTEERAAWTRQREAAQAEIANEIENASPPVAAPPQPRDERGRYVAAPEPGSPEALDAYQAASNELHYAERGVPAGITEAELRAAQNGSLDMSTYLQMRDRLHLGQRDAGIYR